MTGSANEIPAAELNHWDPSTLQLYPEPPANRGLSNLGLLAFAFCIGLGWGTIPWMQVSEDSFTTAMLKLVTGLGGPAALLFAASYLNRGWVVNLVAILVLWPVLFLSARVLAMLTMSSDAPQSPASALGIACEVVAIHAVLHQGILLLRYRLRPDPKSVLARAAFACQPIEPASSVVADTPELATTRPASAETTGPGTAWVLITRGRLMALSVLLVISTLVTWHVLFIYGGY